MEMTSTIDEWYEVLTAFKTRDPNGNGFQDEIPFDGQTLRYFLPAFGVLTVPAGEYPTGSIRLYDNMTLHLESGAARGANG